MKELQEKKIKEFEEKFVNSGLALCCCGHNKDSHKSYGGSGLHRSGILDCLHCVCKQYRSNVGSHNEYVKSFLSSSIAEAWNGAIRKAIGEVEKNTKFILGRGMSRNDDPEGITAITLDADYKHYYNCALSDVKESLSKLIKE